MTRIPIITQNFSSPDVFSDTPLMLLPQGLAPSLPDRDQEGFSQLLLHDLHRHRQSYVRSYTAFETLKKRQDFVLRQENLRSLQNLENRIQAKQDQIVDQSIHSYEQCFVKVINGNLNAPGHPNDPGRRVRSAGPSSDKFHLHQLSHATPLDPPPMTPFHRYQKSHRPPKYRSRTSLHRSAQSFHDAFQSSSFSYHSQPFLSFTESYLQKYADRSTSKYPYGLNDDDDDDDEIDEMRERIDEEYEEGNVQKTQPLRSASAELTRAASANRRLEKKPTISDLQRIRATISSRNTNTPITSPQMGYHDAVRDGLIATKENIDQNTKPILSNEKRRSSQQSVSQQSNSDRSNTKRPKTAKKKQVVVNLVPDKQDEGKTADNNLFKSAMFVQNYESTTTTSNATIPSKIERVQVPVILPRKTSSILRRPSLKSVDVTAALKKTLDNIDTQIITTERLEQTKVETNNQLPTTTLPTIPSTEVKQANTSSTDQPTALGSVDVRKRVRKGAFEGGDSMADLVQFELGLFGNNRGAMKKNRFGTGKANNLNGEEVQIAPENQGTLDLLEKIRQSAVGLSIGQPPVSQQGSRFELPYDLKLLENLTPLEYLSKYCRLSTRRHYHFKRIFDKYRNNQYRFESNNLYTSIVDVHTEAFTRAQFDEVCQLIDLGNEQHQFTFDTFAGILALCERILFGASKFRNVLDDSDLAKHPIEQCDFDSLERKLDGLQIGETLNRLLKRL